MSVSARYSGACGLLAECSRRLARYGGGGNAELLMRIGIALEDYVADSSVTKLIGDEDVGFDFDVDLEALLRGGGERPGGGS